MTQTPETKEPVQQLADLIDAYATAKASGNETLVRIAVQPLQNFLGAVDIVPKSLSEEATEPSYDSSTAGEEG